MTLSIYQADEEADRNSTIFDRVVLHPRSPDGHPALEVVCGGDHTDEHGQRLADSQWSCRQRLKVRRLLGVLRSGEPTRQKRYGLEFPRDPHLTDQPRLQTLSSRKKEKVNSHFFLSLVKVVPYLAISEGGDMHPVDGHLNSFGANA